MSTVLLTSIPPIKDDLRLNERLSYQKKCIATWLATGHQPISLNSEHEIPDLMSLFPEVDFHAAYRSTAPINHRNLVYISDLIALALEQPCERLAICNADVFFEPTIQFTAGLPSGLPLAYSHRIDIANFEIDIDGKTFFGIDYVNLSKNFAAELTDTIFALGLPWWDYWLPLDAIRKGFKPVSLTWDNRPLLQHLLHGDRWDASSLVYLGQHALTLIGLGHDLTQTNQLEIQQRFFQFREHFEGNGFQPSASIYASLARDLCRYIQENSHTHDFRPQ